MRKIDLHAYPGTKEWIDCQGPYVDALAAYWKREWTPKAEADVIAEFEKAGVDVCLVALDLSTRVTALERENERLQNRLAEATSRAKQMLERVRFLRQQARGSER